jgi:hypothetical protein
VPRGSSRLRRRSRANNVSTGPARLELPILGYRASCIRQEHGLCRDSRRESRASRRKPCISIEIGASSSRSLPGTPPRRATR